MSRWAGTLFVGERWLVYDGPLAGTGQHAHHAAQVISASEPFGLVDHEGRRTSTASAVIPPDQEHELHADGQRASIVYVEQGVSARATGAPEWANAGIALALPPAGVATMAEARGRADALAEVLRMGDTRADGLVEEPCTSPGRRFRTRWPLPTSRKACTCRHLAWRIGSQRGSRDPSAPVAALGAHASRRPVAC